MRLSEARERSDAEAADWLEDLPRATLQAMLEAGREALEWRRILAKTGDNLVGEVLKHEGPFYVLDHYPKGDVFDPESPSPMPISVEAQVALLERRLGR